MWKTIYCLLLTALTALTAFAQDERSSAPQPSPASAQIVDDTEPLKVDANLVNIVFTATDKNRRYVTNLTKSDFQILENKQPQRIFAFQQQAELPLSLAILIDRSGSQERTLPEEKRAAMSFLKNNIRQDKDEVAILSFTGEIVLEQDFTGNLSKLERAIERIEFIHPPGYLGGGVVAGSRNPSSPEPNAALSTAVWDAIWVTSENVLRDSPEKTRRVIILLSDGVNNYGMKTVDAAIKQAVEVDAVIYCIGIGDYYSDAVDKKSLKKLAGGIGGKAFFPKEEKDFTGVFEQIRQELGSQYLIAYEPSDEKKEGAFPNIEIQIVNPAFQKQKIKLAYRQGYFAQKKIAKNK